jgi:anti-anti-sigma factor
VTAYELELRATEEQGIALVEASGELDLTNAADVEQRLDELASGAGALVLDLNGVSFIDSAALHMFFRIGRLRGVAGFGIVLDPTATIARTLDIVGLDNLVSVRASYSELVGELGE